MSYQHPMNARITRTARKEINPRLFRAGLPTLGAHDTLAEYRATLTKAQKVVFADLTGTRKPESTGYVRAQIRAAKAARENAQEFAALMSA